MKEQRDPGAVLFLILCVCSATVLLCLCIYRFDNKYTYSGPQASRGILSVSEDDLKEYPVMMLVDGWEFYSGQLLTPDDIDSNEITPDEYIYIGYYGGLEADNPDASPHGSATYRLRLELPVTQQFYTLELPEIFSAYRAYINGTLVAGMGNPDPENYQPETLNRTVTFEAAGTVEILIAVSDFSHLYSGMVYPPAFGAPDMVSRLLFMRFLFRAFLSITALIIGVLSIIIGILNRQRLIAVLYGLLCLFFVGYISYPIIKTFISSYYPFYILENISYCAMLFVIVRISLRMCRLKNRGTFVFSLFSLFIGLACIVLHLSLSSGNIRIIYGYSYLISIFEWLMAGFLTVIALYAVWHKNLTAKPLLAGIMAFDTSLVMDRLLPLHEPIITGWFPELASFLLILLIGLTTGRNIAWQYTRNTILETRAQNMSRLLQMQRNYYPLMQEKIKQAKTARHDLRHHLLAIGGFLENSNYEGLKGYFSDYQKLPHDAVPINYCQNEVADILAHYYMHLAQTHNINLTFRMDICPDASIADDDLCSLLSNLLENAFESCLRQTNGKRFITFTAKTQYSILAIYMENSCPAATQSASGFLSSKEYARTGYGLDSIKAVVMNYNGTADFQFDKNMELFKSQVTLELCDTLS
ncbi:MAG: sensor histidine kinase [Lachnospiraceae bacterium]